MIHVVLSIGSNCNDKEGSVRRALEMLDTILKNMVASEIYETKAVGHNGSPYMNCVCEGDFEGFYDDLDILLKEYEISEGRNELSRKNGMVPIDIDPVIVDEIIIRNWDYSQKFFQKGFKEIRGTRGMFSLVANSERLENQ